MSRTVFQNKIKNHPIHTDMGYIYIYIYMYIYGIAACRPAAKNIAGQNPAQKFRSGNGLSSNPCMYTYIFIQKHCHYVYNMYIKIHIYIYI